MIQKFEFFGINNLIRDSSSIKILAIILCAFSIFLGFNTNTVWAATFTIGQAASVALGQTGLSSNSTGTASTNLNGPSHLAFDSSGNLWVSDYNNNRVLEYPAANLATGGAATVVLGQTGFNSNSSGTASTSLSGPGHLTFDSSGNLWVSDYNNNRVLEYPAASLATGGAATVALGQTSLNGNSSGKGNTNLNGPNGLVFDSSGNLWVADCNNNRILEYPTVDLVTGGTATPTMGKTNSNGGPGDTSTKINGPNSLIFDYSGNLWVSDYNNNRVLEYIPPALNLVSATVNTPYSQTFTATGGSAPYSWSVISGSLPSGLSLATSTENKNTTISGIPTSLGTSNFTLQMIGGGLTTVVNYSLQVIAAASPFVTITTPVSGATVSSTIVLSASSTDILGVTGVQFQLDGVNLGSEVVTTSSPHTYSYSWNTASSVNGYHTISAIAYNTANTTSTAFSAVTVANAPVISNIQTSVTTSTATITWMTDEPATAQVQYGLTSAYGLSSALNSTPTTTQSVTLSGLSPYTTYHFMVESSADGFLSNSSDQTFIYLPIPTSSTYIALSEPGAIRSILVGNYLYANQFAFPQLSGINVVDTRTNTIVKYINLDNTICGYLCGWDPDYDVLVGTNLYVISQDWNQIAVINTLTNTVTNVINSTEITNTNGPLAGATLVGTNLYVNNPDDCNGGCFNGTNPVSGIATGTVSVINTLTNTVVATIPVGLVPSYSTLVGTNLYVNNSGGGTVSVINTLTNTVVATIPVGIDPTFSTLVGTNLYVNNFDSGTVSVINTLTNTVTATIPGGSSSGYSVFVGNNKLYSINSEGISVINTLTNTVTATIPGNFSPPRQFGLPGPLVGNDLFVPSDLGGSTVGLSVINTLTNTVVATIPQALPDNSLVLVGTNLYGGYFTRGVEGATTSSISVIDTLANRILDINAPVLISFTSASANGTYTSGQSVNITANFGESLGANSTMTVILNTGATVTLNAVSGDTLSGAYVVGSGDTSVPDLNVASIASAIVYSTSGADIGVSYSVPPHPQTVSAASGNISDTSKISIAKPYFTIPVGANPAQVAAAGNVLYIANKGSSTISVVNTNNNTLITTIPVGSQPYGVAYDATTQEVYVTNTASSTVSVIDANPSDGTYNTVTNTISVGSDPYGVAASGTLVYVANNLSDTISVINATTHAVLSIISVGDAPTGVAVFGTNVYVANSNVQPYFNFLGEGGTVSVIDANPSDGTYNTVTNTIMVGADPQGITVSGTSIYVTNATDGTVSVIDANPSDGTYNTVTNTISVGNNPNGILASGSNVYVENFNDGTISVIAAGNNTVSATVPAGSAPVGMASVGSTLYLSRFTDGELSSLNTTNSTMNGIPALAGITPSTLPNATTSVAYSQILTETGGVAPYTWSVASGTLPTGLLLATSSTNSTTTISGTPTSIGTSNFTIQVQSGDGSTSTQAYSLTVNATLPTLAATPTTTNLATSSVTLNGNLTATGVPSSTVLGFNYGTSTSYGSVVSSTGSFSPGAFTQNITGLLPNTTYDFQAFATNSGGTVTSSNATFTIPSGIIPSITAFTASPGVVALNGTATLSWNVSNASSVTITPGGFATSTLIGSTTTPALSTTTIYTLTATNANGTSTLTTTVQVATAPTAPGNLMVGSSTSSTISLSWASSTPNNGATISSYSLYRGMSSTTVSTFVATTTDLFLTDSSLATFTTYWYNIVAQDSVGNMSAASANASGTTLSGIIPTLAVTPIIESGGSSFLPATTTGIFSTTTSASAASTTVAQTQAYLASLESQLRTLEAQVGKKASSAASLFAFARNLRLGMTGADVKALQLFLIAQNAGDAAQKLNTHGATQYFGPLTKVALVEFQKKVGIRPAVGYFGPITRKYINLLQ